MKKVYKYTLDVGIFTITSHEDAIFLHADTDPAPADNNIRIWALVDTNKPYKDYTFEVVGTGHEIQNKNIEYMGSVKTPPYIWHIFQVLTHHAMTYDYF